MQKPYGLYCPTSKACEVLEPRWTLLILGELWAGATRFNEIRRGLPGISPALLSKRLKEMEANGLVERVEDAASGNVDYIRTEKAAELDDVIRTLARWAQRHIDAEVAVGDRDSDGLMWGMREKLDARHLPRRRVVIRFNFTDSTSPVPTYWVIAVPGQPVEYCVTDPSHDVDVFIEAEVSALTAIYLGRSRREVEEAAGRLFVTGDVAICRTFDRWFPRSEFAATDGTRRRAS